MQEALHFFNEGKEKLPKAKNRGSTLLIIDKDDSSDQSKSGADNHDKELT